MKKRNKKLVLNRETVIIIQDDALVAAPGAATFQYSLCRPCGTQETISPCTCATK